MNKNTRRQLCWLVALSVSFLSGWRGGFTQLPSSPVFVGPFFSFEFLFAFFLFLQSIEGLLSPFLSASLAHLSGPIFSFPPLSFLVLRFPSDAFRWCYAVAIMSLERKEGKQEGRERKKRPDRPKWLGLLRIRQRQKRERTWRERGTRLGREKFLLARQSRSFDRSLPLSLRRSSGFNSPNKIMLSRRNSLERERTYRREERGVSSFLLSVLLCLATRGRKRPL
mmetsp:Transcript_11376/g.21912  ORF Transcript_11376/g.21912 Transcript_11376/m.21912 type:complete len:224 (+) Transcript_11376:162-833(+)